MGRAELPREPPLDEALASRQEMRMLLTAIDGLPAHPRGVFTLDKLQERSSEIARKLSISVSAVEKHMSRALADLTRALGW